MKNKLFAVVISLIIFSVIGTGMYMLLRPQSQYKDVEWETVEHADVYTYKYYLELSTKEKVAYENILKEYQVFPEQIEIPDLTNEELTKVFTAVLYDNPLLFCFNKNCKLLSSGTKYYFQPQYTMTKAEYDAKVKEIQNLTPDIIANLPFGSEYEAELYLHDYIIDRCVYSDTGAFEETNLYGALITGKASCEGYSNAMKYLSDLCNIDCYLIFGTAESEAEARGNHMWNIITIDGEKYHLDATWNDTVAEDDPSGGHRYMYFNITDEEISNTHFDFVTNDKCTSDKASYYTRNDLCFDSYGEAEKQQLAKIIAEAVEDDATSLSIKFASDDLFSKALADLIDEQEIFSVLKLADQKTDKKIETEKFHYRDVDDVNVLEIMFSVV